MTRPEDDHVTRNARERLDECRVDVGKWALDSGTSRIGVDAHDVSIPMSARVADDLHPVVSNIEDRADIQHHGLRARTLSNEGVWIWQRWLIQIHAASGHFLRVGS